jgi:hypothetical protein
MTTGGEPAVPDVTLERYRLGELPPAEMQRIERRLQTDMELRNRIDALARSDEALAAQHPAGPMARRVIERIGANQPRRAAATRPLGRLVLASAVGAGLIAAAMAQPWSRLQPAAVSSDTIKGLEPTLTVYRRTAHGSETLADGAPARAGDLLLLGYVSAGRRYGVILSLDGRGILTMHLPANGDTAAPLRAGEIVLLDQAYELDDAPAWERFYFVAADQPFGVESIRGAARQAAARGLQLPPRALPLPAGFAQAALSIQKEVKP